MSFEGDDIAACVVSTFNKLPKKAKPRSYPDGTREWVPLSGIVLAEEGDLSPTCVALGTGMRCLPRTKIASASGRCLHDWHAEVVAMRALNLYLLDECAKLAFDSSETCKFVRQRSAAEKSTASTQPFCIKEGVRIYMYCSEAPCGDASMELTMDAQHDQTPWDAISVDAEHAESGLKGRAFFSELGIVRRKPARRDAPPTLSKSCSDKLALKQSTSLLSSVTSLLIAPQSAYLHSLVLPKAQHVESAINRAFSRAGRMVLLARESSGSNAWEGGYEFRPFRITTTSCTFEFSRAGTDSASKGTNVTAMWTPSRQEVLIGGTVQGYRQFECRGSSAICRANVWSKALQIANQVNPEDATVAALQRHRYKDVKESSALELRARVKRDVRETALKNWIRNVGDDDFALAV